MDCEFRQDSANLSGAFGGLMGHDWVFDVLADLKSYATANGLFELAAKADEALEVAAAEIAERQARPDGKGPDPKGQKPH